MGLDLMHYKLVEKPVDPGDNLYLEPMLFEELARFGSEHLIQDVPDLETLYTVRFLPDRETLDWAIARRETDGYAPDKVSYMLGTPESCEEQWVALERRLGLERSQAWISGGSFMGNDRKLRHEKFALYSRPSVSKGVYYVEVGYQRKGMTQEFYDDYSHCAYYMGRERFLALPDYLFDDDRAEFLPNLMENFIGNYEPGRSLLVVSA